MLMNFVVLNF